MLFQRVTNMTSTTINTRNVFVWVFVIVALLLLAVYVQFIRPSDHNSAAEQLVWQRSSPTIHLIASPTDPQLGVGNDVQQARCVDAKVGELLPFPVCIFKRREDSFVSGSFEQGGYFDSGIVERFLKLLRRFPNTDMVDLGANLGSYALAVARLTHVVAVEPFRRTAARVAMSVKRGGIGRNVTLLNNAISNQRRSFNLAINPVQFATNHLTTGNKAGLPCPADVAATSPCVDAIVLDDLVPFIRNKRVVIKVDVEGQEAAAFTEATSARFMSQFDVMLVYMEWGLVYTRPEAKALVKFFTGSSRNYTVRDPGNYKQLSPKSYSSWPGNVLFVRRDFDAIYQFH